MKRNLQTILLLCLIFAGQMTNYVMAVTAYPYPVQVKQPDGTTITVVMQGDEKVKWAQTIDGYAIMCNSKGVFEYAKLDAKGDLVLSGIAVSEVASRNASELSYLAKTPKGLLYSKSQVSMMKSIYEIKASDAQKVFPTTGSRKLICILMGYTDKAFTKTQAEFNNLFNQVGYTTGGATGSVKDFYKESSYNQFDLTVTVAGPYTAANSMAYYGGNDASGNDLNPRALVSEAINAADASVNFADFDNDGDGTVDGVYIIYAGYGEEAGAGANCIWAHAWSLASPVTKDGKSISKYSCSAELSGTSGTTMTRIGVICHEFGHVLGSPDYYDTNYATGGQFDGTGKWDLMAAGSWNNNGITPAQHNAYTKVKVYNWSTATVLSAAASVTVNNAETNQSFYQINSTTANEYWILENRQLVGFDANLPGHGLIIYHVSSNVGTSGINATYPQRMYPVCANATTNPGTTAASYGTINGAGCPFPGSGAKTSFTDATTPWMKSWAGANTAKPITNIVENATTKVITFTFMGGGPNPTAPTATTVVASAITNSGATLNAQVNANNASTTVTFEYGTTTSYGSTINGIPNTVTGATLTNITAALTGLTANTTYNFRVKAVNSVGTTYGSNLTFTTTNTTITVPTVTTTSASSITATSATSGGNVTADGGASVTERGICYATTQNPTTANTKVTSGTGTGVFTSNMTGLTANTTYYVRAYAINSAGTAYGAQQSFITLTSSYCASKGSNSTYEWIDLVQFAGINRTSASDGGYKDNTTMVGTVVRGATVPIYFSAGMSSAYTEYWGVWIDFNKNGVFDTNEKMVTRSSSSTATLTANIVIPTTALLGNTRMRVSMKYSATPTACETFSYGEVEDYTVNITAPAPSSEIETSIAKNVEEFTIFPNPVSDRLTVQFKQIDGNATLRIFDIRGALVKKMIINEPTKDIDVSELSKGTYLISIEGVSKSEMKKFIKL